ncbi:MAG: S41 family peptidase [Bacteroidota bacterium]|nr:S41 family peptidase [Bacteroidota bacterium]
MKRLLLPLLLLIVLWNFSACKEDEPALSSDSSTSVQLSDTALANQWIYSAMKLDYLFYKSLPDSASLNYNQDPQTFFNSLRSTQEERHGYYFSYIEKTNTTTTKSSTISTSYGFEFILYPLSSSTYTARILYVQPNSPAAKSGLKRGNWIYKINGNNIMASNYSQLTSGGAVSLTMLTYNTPTQKLNIGSTLSLLPATTVEDNPIFLDTTYTINNTKVGYLVYNSFTTGPTGFDDKTYDNELKSVFAKFKSNGVSKFIVDLRFNGGGYLSSCQLLTSMILPSAKLGSLMSVEEYNDKLSKVYTGNKDYFLGSSEIGSYNINQQQLYVICSQFTASASELLINSMKPYIPVTLVGDTTVGKNMGSFEVTSSKYNYTLHPITIKIYNSLLQSNYSSGFSPEVEFNEFDDINDYLPLGDTNELLLNKVLQKMGLVSSTKSASSASSVQLKATAISSLQRKGEQLIIKKR